MSLRRPTPEQMAAIVRFARRYGHGRRWRSALRACWVTANYVGFADGDDPALLQQVRNQFGPSWLATAKIAIG